LVKAKEKVYHEDTCETVKFPGGDTAFYQFVYSNLDSKILKKYPDLTGYLFIAFVVDTSGSIVSTELLKKHNVNKEDVSDLFKELTRVLLTSPKWEFYNLVKSYNHDENYEFIEDNNLPVNDTVVPVKLNESIINRCKKQKVRQICAFKFPIPKLYLENKK
jgi:hypothetical protein